MAFRRFKKSFDYKNAEGRKIIIPNGWAGDLPDDVARQADKALATYQDASRVRADQPKPEAPKV